eukprot:87198-Pelagomonas_calceolata.AAC.8
MQAAPAIHCLLAPLRQSAADHTPKTTSSTRQGRGCRSCSTSHQQTSVPSPLFMQQLTPSIEHKLKIPSQSKLCKSVGSASWDGLQVDRKVPGTGHLQAPDPEGTLQKYAAEVLC